MVGNLAGKKADLMERRWERPLAAVKVSQKAAWSAGRWAVRSGKRSVGRSASQWAELSVGSWAEWMAAQKAVWMGNVSVATREKQMAAQSVDSRVAS